jgi:hypothetical protein
VVLPAGPSGSLVFPAVQVGFGGLAGGEESPASRSGAVTGNRDDAGRVSERREFGDKLAKVVP